jgi:DNA repair protein RecN (Recombination protein N)
MLKSLLIENYALIDKLHIDFDSGFSVITGETGAGKSIILGALALVLGQRAESKVIRNEEKKCVIEAVFNISNYDLKLFFEENELDYDENCIIRRELTSAGKSRSFINDTPINIAILKDLSNLLIDVHSQHENLLISNKSFQFNIIDTVAHTQPLLGELRVKLQKYKAIQSEIKQLTETAEKEQADVDYFQFQYDQLREANLQEDEQTELESEQEILTHTEEIKSSLAKTDYLLSDEDKGIIISLKDAVKTLGNISSIFPKIAEISNRLESSFIELKDLANEIGVIQNDLEFNQDHLEAISSRLNLIYDLEQKHKVKSVKELLDIENQLKERLENIFSFDEHIEELKKQEKELHSVLMQKAKDLSAKRKGVTKQIEETIGKQLSILGIPNVRFVVSVSEHESINSNGINEIDFLFSANKNIPPQSIAKIASGGEISRVMLCIKALLSDKIDVPTIIFDEIDTGVSGDIADKMGAIMKQMGKKIQVISITHLPQIAAKGSTQYKVFKSDKGEITETQIKKLSKEERVKEIAQMLSGSELSDAAIKNAEFLLNQ